MIRLWYRYWQYMAQAVFCAFFNVRVFGRENVPSEGPVLLVSNHQSYLDPVLCGFALSRELDYIARDTLFKNRLFARYIRSLNAFPIQRSQADLAAVRTIITKLKQGRILTLFAEATRTTDGRIRPIKGGFDLVVRRARATTVPVVIDGAFEAWPRSRRLPGMGTIRVCYGPALSAEQTQKMTRTEFVDCINRTLQQMQSEIRQRYGKAAYDYGDRISK